MDTAAKGDVSVIHWSDGENRIHRDSLATLHQLLDDVEARQGPRALVLTGEGKFFSNGLDLERVGSDENTDVVCLNYRSGWLPERVLGKALEFVGDLGVHVLDRLEQNLANTEEQQKEVYYLPRVSSMGLRGMMQQGLDVSNRVPRDVGSARDINDPGRA